MHNTRRACGGIHRRNELPLRKEWKLWRWAARKQCRLGENLWREFIVRRNTIRNFSPRITAATTSQPPVHFFSRFVHTCRVRECKGERWWKGTIIIIIINNIHPSIYAWKSWRILFAQIAHQTLSAAESRPQPWSIDRLCHQSMNQSVTTFIRVLDASHSRFRPLHK